MIQTSVPHTPQTGRGLALAALILAGVALLVAVLLALVFGGYALLSLMTGAPGHVLATIAHYGALAAVFALPPLAVPALVLALIARIRARPQPADAGAPRRSARGMATTAIVLALVCLVAVPLGVPFWDVEPCWTAQC